MASSNTQRTEPHSFMTTQWVHLQVLPSWNASFGVGTAGRAPCSPMKHTKCCAAQVIYTAARQQQKPLHITPLLTLLHHMPYCDIMKPLHRSTPRSPGNYCEFNPQPSIITERRRLPKNNKIRQPHNPRVLSDPPFRPCVSTRGILPHSDPSNPDTGIPSPSYNQ